MFARCFHFLNSFRIITYLHRKNYYSIDLSSVDLVNEIFRIFLWKAIAVLSDQTSFHWVILSLYHCKKSMSRFYSIFEYLPMLRKFLSHYTHSLSKNTCTCLCE